MGRGKKGSKSGSGAGQNGMPSQRQLRVGEQIRHELSNALLRGHFKDEKLIKMANLITITEVRPSPDLRNAKAYIIPLGGDQAKITVEEALPALNDHSAYFQSLLGQVLEMKFTPRVSFVEDKSFAEAQRIENILYDIQKKKSENSADHIDADAEDEGGNTSNNVDGDSNTDSDTDTNTDTYNNNTSDNA